MAEMSLKEMMLLMPQAFVPEKAVGVNAVVQYHVSGDEPGDWIITIRDGACTVEQGTAQKPNTTLRLSSQDLKGMMTGRLNGMTLFMQGRLVIQGDLGLASRFASFFTRP